MFRLLRRNPALILILLGIFGFGLGFLNEAFRIDIPPQDPPPAVAQKYARDLARNRRQTDNFLQVGKLLLGLGIGVAFVQSVARLTRT